MAAPCCPLAPIAGVGGGGEGGRELGNGMMEGGGGGGAHFPFLIQRALWCSLWNTSISCTVVAVITSFLHLYAFKTRPKRERRGIMDT